MKTVVVVVGELILLTLTVDIVEQAPSNYDVWPGTKGEESYVNAIKFVNRVPSNIENEKPDIASTINSIDSINNIDNINSIINKLENKNDERNRPEFSSLVGNNVGSIINNLDNSRNQLDTLDRRTGLKLDDAGNYQIAPVGSDLVSIRKPSKYSVSLFGRLQSEPTGVVDNSWMTYENMASLPFKLYQPARGSTSGGGSVPTKKVAHVQKPACKARASLEGGGTMLWCEG